jgi:hypothetical protein
VAAAAAAKPEVRSDPQNIPFVGAAGMLLFHYQTIPDMDIHCAHSSITSFNRSFHFLRL